MQDKKAYRQMAKSLLEKINFMAHEINLFMAKLILTDAGNDSKYANKYELTPAMEVKFYLYNTETKTTVCKVYSFERFADICSNKERMVDEFNELVDKLVQKSQTQSNSIIYIEERGLLI